MGEKMKFRATPETVLPAMDKKNSPGIVKPQGRLSFTTGIRLTSCFLGFDLQTTL